MTLDDTIASQPRRVTQIAGGRTKVVAEVAGIVVLLVVAAYFLASSWRKWNHPLIDFGRELYIPWRLSEGAVLYRDVEDVYGPLSQYFNAALFKLFGPGFMVLVTANLVLFSGLLTLSYVLFRRAWGWVGAQSACLVLVSVFAFSQFLVCSNFNYVTPYAHEATHGRVVSLALVAVLGSWIDAPTRPRSFFAGLLLGLNFLLKPEYILAGFALTGAAFAIRVRRAGAVPTGQLAVFGAAAVLPTAGFVVYFLTQHFTLLGALDAASRAWTSLIVHPEIVAKKYQLIFVGFDQPWNNFVFHVRKTVLVVIVLSWFGAVTVFALKRPQPSMRWTMLVLTVALAALTANGAEWGDIGRCLLGLNLIFLGLVWNGPLRRFKPGGEVPAAVRTRRLLLGMLATVLMSRMVLSGRIFQFGFFQAALSTMVVVAVICAESAEWMPPVRGRRLAAAAVGAALLLPGIVWCTTISQRYLKAQTYAVGEGQDQFYYFPPEADGSGYLINRVVEALRTVPRDATLLVLPEGEMINYLARRRSPLPQFQYYSFTTEDGRERMVVENLDRNPPDYVVIISRDLNDFGIERYGQRDGEGREIVQWIDRHYRITHHFGNDPLSSNQRGAFILQHVPATEVNGT